MASRPPMFENLEDVQQVMVEIMAALNADFAGVLAGCTRDTALPRIIGDRIGYAIDRHKTRLNKMECD